MWSFQYGIKGDITLKEVKNKTEIQEFVSKEGLRYYNEDIHANTFALPNFVKELVRKK
jgi:spermidine synthase